MVRHVLGGAEHGGIRIGHAIDGGARAGIHPIVLGNAGAGRVPSGEQHVLPPAELRVETGAEFEQRFAAFHEAKYAIGVANGSVSLEIALAALGIGAGDEVIVPPYTFVTSASSVLKVNALPVRRGDVLRCESGGGGGYGPGYGYGFGYGYGTT